MSHHIPAAVAELRAQYNELESRVSNALHTVSVEPAALNVAHIHELQAEVEAVLLSAAQVNVFSTWSRSFLRLQPLS